jgi:hypothetical protein
MKVQTISRTGLLLAKVALVAIAGLAAPAWAQNVSLGTASQFGVLAGSTVTNTGPTVVTGSVGVSPGSAITGFPPGSIVPGSGSLHAADSVAAQAQLDLTAAYTDAANRVCGTAIAGGVLGGLVLTPGVYCMGAGDLTGVLTLNGAGVYIFQMASDLITAPGSSVVLLNGASACGVWWQVTSSATVGTTSAMVGNIMALTSISLNTNASLNGRALARNGQVSLQSNQVTACVGGPAPAVPPLPLVPFTDTRQVPTLSEWAMILLTGLLALTGFGALRRRAR